ncbi:MAG: glycolate oxidase subunit GlcE, partial [Gammaproteobacteria bacterium]
DQIIRSYDSKTPLVIQAGNSKSFYGRDVEGESLLLAGHQGILSYQASELVITARSGTRLSELESALDEHGQQLAFEPPLHTDQATLGGAIASGLSGPARAFRGAARDFVLGAKIINGKGELMQFGGQVMKNVAGYDVSRLMVGAQGTLGVLTEISLKVLPKTEAETTLAFDVDAAQGHQWLRDWLHQGQPITASCHYQGTLSVRLSSTANSIAQAYKKMGGEMASGGLWPQLRHQTHPYFQQDHLWRLSLPPSTSIHNEDKQLIEWGGALRWKASNSELFEQARRLHGHATRYTLRAASTQQIFQPLQASMLAIQKRIKHAFDPRNILNPNRLYQEL